MDLQKELRSFVVLLPNKHSGIIVEVINNRNYLHPWLWFRSIKVLDEFCKDNELAFEMGSIKMKNASLKVFVGNKQEFVDGFDEKVKLIVIVDKMFPRFYSKLLGIPSCPYQQTKTNQQPNTNSKHGPE